jgi:oligoribonuclease NrnB/cAMP/cGMP phosphodiesterase (DHH superfamily)
MICIHHNDLDGRCAAAIVARKHACIPVTFFETDYKNPPPNLDELVGETVVIVDFSYKPDVMQRIMERVCRIVWIDHHETAKDYPYQHLDGLRNFEDKGDSGCELTWKYFFPDLPMPTVVRLIGDYDKWALKIPESKIFYEGMKLLDNDPKSDIWRDLLSDYQPNIKALIQAGLTATKYRDNYCDGLCRAFGYETEIDGHLAYACNQYMFGSGGFGERFGKYQLCIAYIHDGSKFTVSLYSETVDVGAIAKAHGGGGHKGAAGFVCEILPFTRR